MPFSAELQTALRAVCTAARACRSIQRGISRDVLDKQDKSPVTVADFASQAIILRELAAAFPRDAVIAEEDAAALREEGNRPFLARIREEVERAGVSCTTDDVFCWVDHGRREESASRFWTLDPIDGTKGFLRGEQYALSLALIVDGQIHVAVLGCPNLCQTVAPSTGTPDGTASSLGAVFTAIRGGGANVLSLDDPTRSSAPVRVSARSRSSEARLCESVESGHSAHDAAARIAARLGVTQPPVRLDSQAKYAVVARGEADAYLRLPTRADYREKIWDHAGGVLVVEEAGGRVTDVAGRPLDFTRGPTLAENRGVIVTNGRLHDAILDAVKSTLTP